MSLRNLSESVVVARRGRQEGHKRRQAASGPSKHEMVAGSACSQRELSRIFDELGRSKQLIPTWLGAYNNLRFDLTTCSESRYAGLQLEDLFGKLDFISVASRNTDGTQRTPETFCCRSRKRLVQLRLCYNPLRPLTQSACT